MKALDRLIQRWRIAKARPFIPAGARVLDVGCADGALFRLVPGIAAGVGIDPFITASSAPGPSTLIKGSFPADLPADAPYDVITMLAVVEHLPPAEQARVAEGCIRFLKPGGRLLVTVPSARVDAILAALKRLRLIDGMSLDQHYQFDASATPAVFGAVGLRLVRHRRFQLGLNNLFVFQKPDVGHPPLGPPHALREARAATPAGG